MAASLPNPKGGFALVSVLWGVAVLSLIAAAVLSSSVLSSKFQKRITMDALGSALADAGIARACLALLDERFANRWRTDGGVQKLDFAGHEVQVTIQDELGRIDLNAADFEILRHLLISVGVDASASEELANRVLDWRESDDLHRTRGFNAASPQGVWRPRHGPYQSVDELLLVQGVTAELFAAISPALTVFSQKANVDPSVAPASVLSALPGMDEGRAADILAERERLGGPSSSSLSRVGRAFAIRAEVEIGTRRFVRSTTIRLTPKGNSPCLVLSRD